MAKDLKDQLIGIYIKQKVRIKIKQMSIDVSFYSNQDANAKGFNALKYCSPKGLIKDYNVKPERFCESKFS